MRAENGKIGSIIFDLGGVLIENPVSGIIRFCAGRLKADAPALSRAHERHAPDFQRGRISEEIYWERICGELGCSFPPAGGSLWGDAFRSAYAENGEIFFLADYLQRKHYRVGLLSDTEVPSMNFFLSRHCGRFDFLVFSCREGSIKPEKEIYQIALARSGVEAAQSVFIDDRLPNVEGAREAGMKAILFEGPRRLKKELAGLGVEIGED